MHSFKEGTYPLVPRCARWHLTSTSTCAPGVWPVRSTACRLGASNLPLIQHCNWSWERLSEPARPKQVRQQVLLTAFDRARQKHATSTRPAFDPVRRNLSTRTTTELEHLNFPRVYPSATLVPLDRSRTTYRSFACPATRRRYHRSPHWPIPPPTERSAAPPSSLRAAPGQEWCIHGSHL